MSLALRQDGFDLTSASDVQQVGLLARQIAFAASAIRVRNGDSAPDGRDGLEFLRELRRALPQCQVIVLVEPGVRLELCRQAVVEGASGFVECPLGQVPTGLAKRLRQALTAYDAIQQESLELHNRTIFDETGFAGQSRRMAQVLLRARRAAVVSDAPILIEGESGTGKQLLAEAIHRLDPKRGQKPFLVVNCAAITGSLAESALFGHTRGAFTGATDERQGYFRAADGGTVLLDEVGELDAPLQPKLLRVLQVGKVLPVGADQEVSVDVRVIAATNRTLMALVAEGKFRLDLYQRLNVISLTLPPLRQRPEDIPVLFDYFVDKYRHYFAGTIEEVDPRVYEAVGLGLGEGNVRELENIVRRILTFKRSGERIELTDLPEAIIHPPGHADGVQTAEVSDAVRRAMSGKEVTLERLMDQCEWAFLVEAIREQGGSKSKAARRLGITRRTLYNKLSKHERDPLSDLL